MRGMPSASMISRLGLCSISWMKAGSTSPMAVVLCLFRNGVLCCAVLIGLATGSFCCLGRLVSYIEPGHNWVYVLNFCWPCEIMPELRCQSDVVESYLVISKREIHLKRMNSIFFFIFYF